MFYIEYLVCKDKKHHRYCHWQTGEKEYADSMFARVVNRLRTHVKKTGIATRIIRNGKELFIIKAQHISGDLYTKWSPYAKLLYYHTKPK